jgi:DNA-binding transcriptional ArsR family regulator
MSIADTVEFVPASAVRDTDLDDDLDAAFAALGDRTRRAMISRLAQRGEATVGELAEPFDLTHQAVSRHVGILRRCGLIRQRVDGQRRPCRLDVERMQELVGWISEQQREWESRLDRLDDHLASVQQERSR